MQSRTSILRATGTSVVALLLVAGAALATSTVVGQRPSSEAQPVSIEGASAEPTDDLETEEPTASLAEDGDDASPTAEATSSPDREDASPDDHGDDDRSGSNSGSSLDDGDDDHSGSGSSGSGSSDSGSGHDGEDDHSGSGHGGSDD